MHLHWSCIPVVPRLFLDPTQSVGFITLVVVDVVIVVVVYIELVVEVVVVVVAEVDFIYFLVSTRLVAYYLFSFSKSYGSVWR